MPFNNTFYGNATTTNEPIIYIQNGGVDFENNIVYDTKIRGVTYNGTTLAVNYNDSFGHLYYNYYDYGGITEVGNLEADPKFTDAAGGDFTLTGFSPCIDMGNPIAGYNDGDTSRNDMGAYGGPYGAW